MVEYLKKSDADNHRIAIHIILGCATTIDDRMVDTWIVGSWLSLESAQEALTQLRDAVEAADLSREAIQRNGRHLHYFPSRDTYMEILQRERWLRLSELDPYLISGEPFEALAEYETFGGLEYQLIPTPLCLPVPESDLVNVAVGVLDGRIPSGVMLDYLNLSRDMELPEEPPDCDWSAELTKLDAVVGLFQNRAYAQRQRLLKGLRNANRMGGRHDNWRGYE